MNSKIECEGNNNSIKNECKEDEIIKRKSSKNSKQEILMTFNHEDEKKDSNIVYNQINKNKKIKYISLDLLLKKIVIDDFIEKNILLIYYFSQQCFCFIETKILFSKINDCFKFYRSQGVPIKYLYNIITFFNILVLEMFDYYKEIKEEDPSLSLINKFYENVMNEFSFESLNNNNQNINNQQLNLKVNNIENLSENNKIVKIHNSKNLKSNKKENEDSAEKYYNNYFSINDEDNNNNKIENKNINNIGIIKVENNDEINDEIIENEKEENNKIDEKFSRKTIHENINNRHNAFVDFVDVEKELNWSNTGGKKIFIKEINEVENTKEKEKKHHFGIFKKLNEKKKKSNKSCDVVRQSFRNNNLKISKKYNTKQEHVLNNIKDIQNLILTRKLDNKILDTIKNSIQFYKTVQSKLIPDKTHIENEKIRRLKKSHSQDNIFKKKKKIELKEYFCVLDWDEKEIGNKLMLLSESLINKIQRKELYKAVYLKKNKNIISPNVMENIDKFNRLSFFIILDILSYDNSKDRAKMIEKWAKIAEYCKKINNFNDLFAINSALNNYIITGLQLTLKEINRKTLSLLKELNKFCDCIGNYKTVRDYISNLKPDEYYLPYLGILLRDLAFYEENSKYIINGVLINLEKIEKIQNIMHRFFKFRYLEKIELGKIPKQLNFFEYLDNIQEEKLERIANNIEPIFNYSQKKVKRLTYIDKKFFLNKEE